MQKELQVKKNYAAVGEEISPALAASFVKSYVETHPEEVKSFQIGKNIIDQILAQPGCCGIRFYSAYNEIGQKTLVYVGVDESGQDILKNVTVGTDGTLHVSSSITGDRAGSGNDTSIWETIKTWLGF
jgi:ABC-type dipeptide/oligopeptide/nickel transport system permease subunit